MGVIPIERLAGDLTPAATAAGILYGWWGSLLLSVAALLAFVSVANAGILSASRYPLAMSRDRLLPVGMSHVTAQGVPVRLADRYGGKHLHHPADPRPRGHRQAGRSAFQLVVFAVVCLAVVVMRESRIAEYDPGIPLAPGTPGCTSRA